MNDDTYNVDVLIAGSGAAGLSAALTARKAGLSVLLVEKEPLFGGTTAYSAGVIWVPLNDHAKKRGIQDSREAALTYMSNEAGNHFDQARAEIFVDKAAEMVRTFELEGWVKFELARTWADYHPNEPGGVEGGRALVPGEYDGKRLGKWFEKLRPPLATMMGFEGMMIGRTDFPHVFSMSRSFRSLAHVAGMSLRYFWDRATGHARGTRLMNGNALVAQLAERAIHHGVELWLDSPLVQLERNERVDTAVIRRNGRELSVTVNKGVILASGGFPRAADRTGAAYSHLVAGKNHVPLPPEGNTGDGADLAESMGGRVSGAVSEPAAWTPVSQVPQADGSLAPYPHFVDRGKPGYIAVDRRGRRFVCEANSYHDFVSAMFEACEGDDEVAAWIVCDSTAIAHFGLGALGPSPIPKGAYIRSGYIKTGNSLAELAIACAIDASGLKETVAQFNVNAAQGIDPDFGRGSDAYHAFNGDPLHKPNPSLGPLKKPPFYAVKVEPAELGTFAGIATDVNSQVLDDNGEPIPGLYAVGNDALSVMGGAYPGAGITIGPAMTFGYLAAKHIAE